MTGCAQMLAPIDAERPAPVEMPAPPPPPPPPAPPPPPPPPAAAAPDSRISAPSEIETAIGSAVSPVAASEALAALARRRFSEDDLAGARAALDAATDLNTGWETDAERTLALAAILGMRSRLGYEAGDYLAAIADARRGLELRRALPDPDMAEVATLTYDLARAHDGRGDNEQAETAAFESYEIRRDHLGQVHEKTADSLNLYANALTAQGRHAEADPAYRQVLGMYEVLYGPKDRHVAIVLSNLGNSLRRTNRGEQADPLYRRAVAIAEISGDKALLAQCLNNYGWFLHTRGDGAKAEIQFRRSLVLITPVIGENHAFVGVLRANIGYALLDQGRAAEAQPEFAHGLSVLERGLGVESPDLLETLGGSALSLSALGRHDEAEQQYRRMDRIAGARLSATHPEALKGSGAYARFLLEQDRPADALGELRNALAPLTAQASGGRDWRTSVRGAGPLFGRRVEASWRLATLDAAASSTVDQTSRP